MKSNRSLFIQLKSQHILTSTADLWFQRAAMYAEDGDGNIYNDNSSTEADGEHKPSYEQKYFLQSQIAWCPWRPCLEEGFLRVVWATNWAGSSSTCRCSWSSSCTSGLRWPPLMMRATASATWAPGASPLEHSTNLQTQSQLCLDHCKINFEPQRRLEICCVN